jgi:hypothetical protein
MPDGTEEKMTTFISALLYINCTWSICKWDNGKEACEYFRGNLTEQEEKLMQQSLLAAARDGGRATYDCVPVYGGKR